MIITDKELRLIPFKFTAGDFTCICELRKTTDGKFTQLNGTICVDNQTVGYISSQIEGGDSFKVNLSSIALDKLSAVTEAVNNMIEELKTL